MFVICIIINFYFSFKEVFNTKNYSLQNAEMIRHIIAKYFPNLFYSFCGYIVNMIQLTLICYRNSSN